MIDRNYQTDSGENFNSNSYSFDRTGLAMAEDLNKDCTIQPFKKHKENVKTSYSRILPIFSKSDVPDEENKAESGSSIHDKENCHPIDPREILENFELGNQKMYEKDYNNAIEYYNRVLKANKRFYQARFNCAIAFYSINGLHMAVSHLKRAVKINREESNPCVMLGQLCDRIWNTGSKHYEKALQRDKNNTEVYLIRANRMAIQINPQTSIKEFERVVNMSKDDGLTTPPDFTLIKEKVLSEEFSIYNFMEFSFAEEVDMIKGAIALKAYLNIAQVLIREGNYEKASELYEEIAQKYPHYLLMIDHRHAQLNILQKNYLGAVQKLTKVLLPLTISPDKIAREQENLKGIDEQEISSLEKDHQKVWCYLRMGMYKEALKTFEEFPGEHLSNWQLAKVYIMLRREQEAAEQLREACLLAKTLQVQYRLAHVPFDTTIKTLSEKEKAQFICSTKIGIECYSITSNESQLNFNQSSIINVEKTQMQQESSKNEFRKNNMIITLPSPLDEMENQENVNDPVARCLRFGNRDFYSKDYKKALREYQRALKNEPKCYEALYNCGITLYCLGKLKEAAEKFEAAVKQKPYDSNVYILLGQIYQKLKENKLARQTYSKVIMETPFNNTALIFLGNLFGKRHHYHKALENYNRAIHIAVGLENPDLLEFGILEESKIIDDSDFEDFDDQENIPIDLSENSLLLSSAGDSLLCDLNRKETNIAVIAYLNMAQVLVMQGAYEKAAKIYEKVISKYKDSENYKKAAYSGLHKLYMKETKYYKAAQMFAKLQPNQYLNLSNETADQHMKEEKEDRRIARIEGKKGNDYMRKGDLEGAITSFYKSYEKNKTGFLPNIQMAKAKIIEGNIEEAAKFLEEAHFSNPHAFDKYKFRDVPVECYLKTL